LKRVNQIKGSWGGQKEKKLTITSTKGKKVVQHKRRKKGEKKKKG